MSERMRDIEKRERKIELDMKLGLIERKERRMI